MKFLEIFCFLGIDHYVLFDKENFMGEKEPLVTIGLPFRNPGKYVIMAIKSILCQTYNNWELILINDGSDDGSEELVKTIKDKRIYYINDYIQRGLPYRLNQIIEHAKGKYIARMDADDIMHPERIEKQVKFLEIFRNIDVVDTGAYIIDENNLIIGKTKNFHGNKINLYHAFKWGVFLHPSVMGKTLWFKKYKYSDGFERAEDRELFIRAWAESQYAHISEKLHYYRKYNIDPKLALRGYVSERTILRLYGPMLIGKLWSNIYWTRSIIKSGILMAMDVFKLNRLILKKIFENVTESEKHEAELILKYIKSISFKE